MDGLFKMPGSRASVAVRSRAPPPPPRIPAASLENLTAWRNSQQNLVIRPISLHVQCVEDV